MKIIKTIYKYQLQQGLNNLEIPYIKILSVINQSFTPTLYALVDTDKPNKKLQIIVAGTGWELDDNVADSNYLGTIHNDFLGKSLVWHVFYK